MAESEAIQSASWDTLAVVQRQKATLRLRVDTVPMDLDASLKSRVNRLMEMERKNYEALGLRMAAVEKQLADLDQSSSQLKRVQKSYTESLRGGASFTTTA